MWVHVCVHKVECDFGLHAALRCATRSPAMSASWKKPAVVGALVHFGPGKKVKKSKGKEILIVIQ